MSCFKCIALHASFMTFSAGTGNNNLTRCATRVGLLLHCSSRTHLLFTLETGGSKVLPPGSVLKQSYTIGEVLGAFDKLKIVPHIML